MRLPCFALLEEIVQSPVKNVLFNGQRRFFCAHLNLEKRKPFPPIRLSLFPPMKPRGHLTYGFLGKEEATLGHFFYQ